MLSWSCLPRPHSAWFRPENQRDNFCLSCSSDSAFACCRIEEVQGRLGWLTHESWRDHHPKTVPRDPGKHTRTHTVYVILSGTPGSQSQRRHFRIFCHMGGGSNAGIPWHTANGCKWIICSQSQLLADVPPWQRFQALRIPANTSAHLQKQNGKEMDST